MSTLTVYPDSGTGGTTTDGDVLRSIASPGETFGTIRGGAGTGVGSTDEGKIQLSATTTLNQYGALIRFIATFDTSPLTSSATISATVCSLAGEGTKQTIGLGATPIHIATATPASNNSLVNADYGQTGSTSFANIASLSWVQGSSYNDFTLDANGIANVSKTGISRFSWRLGWDIDNSFGGVWVSNLDTTFGFWTADASGTSTDPKLVITYTLPATARTRNMLLGVG